MEHKIDFTQPEKYQLLIRLHWPNEISFYVYSDKSPSNGLYIPLSQTKAPLFTESLKDVVFADKRLSLSYNKVSVLFVNNLYTFVPDDIYSENESKKELFLKFNFENIEKNEVLTNKIDSCKITNLFGIQKDLFDFLQRTFPSVEYVHHITPLLRYFLRMRAVTENARVYVHLTNSYMSVFCFRSNRIEAVNTFSYSDANDAAYFVLMLWDKLKFDQLSDRLHIAGISDNKTDLITILSRFIENVIPMNNPVLGENKLILPFDLQSFLSSAPPVFDKQQS